MDNPFNLADFCKRITLKKPLLTLEMLNIHSYTEIDAGQHGTDFLLNKVSNLYLTRVRLRPSQALETKSQLKYLQIGSGFSVTAIGTDKLILPAKISVLGDRPGD